MQIPCTAVNSRENLRNEVNDIVWWHTIDLGNGIVTPGRDETPQEPTDTVDASGATNVVTSIGTARAAAETDRAARLNQLAAQLKTGTYHPDPQKIADQILDAAQIDAALRSLLS